MGRLRRRGSRGRRLRLGMLSERGIGNCLDGTTEGRVEYGESMDGLGDDLKRGYIGSVCLVYLLRKETLGTDTVIS